MLEQYTSYFNVTANKHQLPLALWPVAPQQLKACSLEDW